MMGDGLALLDPLLFHEEIKAGRLVRPFDLWLDEGYGYYLTTHPEDLSNEAVALFRSWLIARFSGWRDGSPARARTAPPPSRQSCARRNRGEARPNWHGQTPFWRAHGLADSARRVAATNRDRRRLTRNPGNPMTTDSPPQDTGRRRRRATERGGGAGASQPQGQPQLPFAPVELVSRDELESIHQAALTVLKEIGVDFLHDEARAMLKDAGADVDPASRRVRFEPALVEAHIGLAPKEFRLHARNSARDLSIGGRHVAFGTVASAPNSFDRAGGRRPGNRRDYQNFIRLGQSFNSIHFIGGYPVEPIDIPASIRHLDALFDMLTLSDKPVHAYSLGRERNLDAIEMVKIARGLDDETLEREPSLFTVINSSSPLRLDTPMLEGIIQMARRNQVVVMTPFTLAGAMAPVTLAGALAQQHAEALAGLVMTQVARPGAPFIYGGFTSNVDMKSGAPAFGTPEYMKTAIVGGQLARRLGLPYRSSNANAANSLDAQAAYESVFSLWGAIMGGVNFLMHGAGWMEGGLQASFEKMALDADLLAMVAEFLRPLRVDEAELALEAMREVGPGGHFFGAEHTQSRYRTAFFPPTISDWRNYETWREAGSPTAVDAAERIVADRLRDFVAPPLEAERLEALTAFVARRKAEGGAPTDF